MPFQKILQQLFALEGVEAVVFLDAEGETILCYGKQEQEKLKLVGAYQGILLTVTKRLGMTPERTIVTLCGERSILTHHLKEGYFLSIIFSSDVNFAYAQFRFQEVYASLEKEL